MKKALNLDAISGRIVDEKNRIFILNTIINKIHSTSQRIRFTILVGCIFLSFPPTRLTIIIGVSFFIFTILIQNIYGKNSVFYAAIIDSVFSTKEKYEEDEINNIKERMFYSNKIDNSIIKINLILAIILSIIMYLNVGIYSILFFLIISHCTHLITLRSKNMSIEWFDLQIKNFSKELVEEYNFNIKPKKDFILIDIKDGEFYSIIYLLIIFVYIKTGILPNSAWEYIIIFITLVVLKIAYESQKYRTFTKDRFYKPKYPFVSYLLSFHDIVSIICETIWVMISISYLGIYASIKNYFIYGIILGSFMVLFSRFILANTLITLLKWFLNDKYSILVFRKYEDLNSAINKRVVTPSLGAYGHVINILDNTFLNSKSGITADTEAILSNSKEYIFCTDNNWQDRVLFELKKANLVVFHWEEVPSENMLWELFRTLEVIPHNQILFITNPYVKEAMNYIFKEPLEGLNFTMKQINHITFDPDSKDPVLLLNKKFNKDLYSFMTKN